MHLQLEGHGIEVAAKLPWSFGGERALYAVDWIAPENPGHMERYSHSKWGGLYSSVYIISIEGLRKSVDSSGKRAGKGPAATLSAFAPLGGSKPFKGELRKLIETAKPYQQTKSEVR